MSTNIGNNHGNNGVGYISTAQVNCGEGCEGGLRMKENTLPVDIVQNRNEYVVHNELCATENLYQFFWWAITGERWWYICDRNEFITPQKLTNGIKTMQLKWQNETKQVKVIKRDLIPQTLLQLYHTEASKNESPLINGSDVEKDLKEMKILKLDVSGHGQIEIKNIMVSAAAHVNKRRCDGELVQTFKEIGNVWKYWNRINIYNLPSEMFYVLYGWFDKNPDWNS